MMFAKSMFRSGIEKLECALVSLAFKIPEGRREEFGGEEKGERHQECKKRVSLLDRLRFGPKSLMLNPRPSVPSWGILYLLL